MTEKVVFYSSLMYNVLMNKFNLRKWYDRIDQHVLLGALPLKGQFPKMLVMQENVRAVISMNQDFELKMFGLSHEEWKCLGVEFLQLPTKDFVEVPSLSNLQLGVQMMMRIVNNNSTQEQPLVDSFVDEKSMCSPSIYVHCKAGRTRSATLVACYLVRCYNMTAEEAVIFIRNKRPHIELSPKHLDVIRQYRDSLNRD